MTAILSSTPDDNNTVRSTQKQKRHEEKATKARIDNQGRGEKKKFRRSTVSSDLIFWHLGGVVFRPFSQQHQIRSPRGTHHSHGSHEVPLQASRQACCCERILDGKVARPLVPDLLLRLFIPPLRFILVSKPTASPRSGTKVNYFTLFCATVRQAGNSYWNLP